jgi:hypothetical protein
MPTSWPAAGPKNGGAKGKFRPLSGDVPKGALPATEEKGSAPLERDVSREAERRGRAAGDGPPRRGSSGRTGDRCHAAPGQPGNACADLRSRITLSAGSKRDAIKSRCAHKGPVPSHDRASRLVWGLASAGRCGAISTDQDHAHDGQCDDRGRQGDAQHVAHDEGRLTLARFRCSYPFGHDTLQWSEFLVRTESLAPTCFLRNAPSNASFRAFAAARGPRSDEVRRFQAQLPRSRADSWRRSRSNEAYEASGFFTPASTRCAAEEGIIESSTPVAPAPMIAICS